jgi:hypothetical protein
MVPPLTPSKSDPLLDISYLELRKTIGWIGIFMPWVVRVAAMAQDRGIPFLMSISAYYHSPARDVFVGSLFAAGVFLCFYRGSLGSLQDRILGVVWGLAAAFIGLLPMNPCNDTRLVEHYKHLTCSDHHHIVAVTVFFAISIYMSIFRFPKLSQPVKTAQKVKRNKVYVVCGALQLIAVAWIAYVRVVAKDGGIFLPEALAIGAFGVAWLVKGQLVLADK